MVIPDRYECKPITLTIGLDMDLKRNGNTFGQVVQRMGLREKYELMDMYGRVVAVSEKEFLSTTHEITTPLGSHIATFES